MKYVEKFLSIWTITHVIPFSVNIRWKLKVQKSKKKQKEFAYGKKEVPECPRTSKRNGILKNCSFFTSSMVLFASWTALAISPYHSILGRCIPMLMARTAKNSGRKKVNSRRHVTRRREVLPPTGCVSSYLPDIPVRNLTLCESRDAIIHPGNRECLNLA